jgi:Flp pilus assembly pilin Flp
MLVIGRRMLKDENGSAITEYAIVLGLVIVGAIAVITQVGPRVLARWTSVDTTLGSTPTNVR